MPFLPITREEMKERGIEQFDFVYVIGDAYVDHSSFGPAIISRVLEANGYIRFTDGATDLNNLDSVFASKGNDYSQGTALEFSVYPNHIELIDKDCVPMLTKTDGTALLTPALPRWTATCTCAFTAMN